MMPRLTTYRQGRRRQEESVFNPPAPHRPRGLRTPHHVMLHTFQLASLIAISVGLAAATLAGQEHTATTKVDGQQLSLRAKATRATLFGTVELYSVGIYTRAPVAGVRELRRSSVTKAVRVAVLYDGGMPGKVPAEWWQELIPALNPREEQKLRAAFSKLSSGDDVWISYAPGRGTRMMHAGNVVVSTKSDELMNAVLDLWLGSIPVSSEVHDTLVAELGRSGQP